MCNVISLHIWHKPLIRGAIPLEMNKMTTQQVAAKLGIDRTEILLLVNRYPQLRPAKRRGQSYEWEEAEIAALQTYLVSGKPEESVKRH